LKFPYYKKMGYPDGVYRVGPLGRLNLAEKIDTPLADRELKIFKSLNNGKPVENTLYYHYARLIEALFAAERVRVLCEDPDILSTDILNTRRNYTGHGVGVLEAPRGTLIHDYTADENGKLLKVNRMLRHLVRQCEGIFFLGAAHQELAGRDGDPLHAERPRQKRRRMVRRLAPLWRRPTLRLAAAGLILLPPRLLAKRQAALQEVRGDRWCGRFVRIGQGKDSQLSESHRCLPR